MTEKQAVVWFLRIIGARRRLRTWEALPPTPLRDQLIANEQKLLARLETQKEVA